MSVTLAQFEAVDGAYQALTRMGDFETCADPRAWVRASNILLDACLAAGMPYETAVHDAWAAEFLTDCLLSADMVEDA